MIINLWALHHSEEEWDQPDQFMPGECLSAPAWPLGHTASLDSAPLGQPSFLPTRLATRELLAASHRPVAISIPLEIAPPLHNSPFQLLKSPLWEVCRHLSPSSPVPLLLDGGIFSSSSLFILPEYLISSWPKRGLRLSGQKLGLWLTLPSVSRALLRPNWKPSRYTLIKLPALRSGAPLLSRRGSGPSRALPLHGLPAAEV